jgi:ATP-dependent DNA ligase
LAASAASRAILWASVASMLASKACELGLDGIVSKRVGSFYRSDPSRNCLKPRTRFR